MLELPECNHLAAQLRETVAGKEIELVEAARSPHRFSWYFGEPADYDANLRGKSIDDVRSFGGKVEIHAGDYRLLIHDGVNARYLAPGSTPPEKHQLFVRFTDGSSLVCTVQMYGGILAYPQGEYDNFYYKVAQEKPTPLSDRFDAAYFDGLCAEAGPKKSAKALLATEQRIPGLGNGCLQDILFHARVNPQSRLSALRDSDLEAMYKSVKSTLRAMTDQGGRDTEKDLFGKPGGYATVLSSKTAAYACRSCGGGITRKAYLGGNVYYCPACQPLLK